MPMNEELARIYNTNGVNSASEENTSKTASLTMFAKLASKHGVDLSEMDDTEIATWYEQVMGEKLAADGEGNGDNPFPPKKKDDEEKEKKDDEDEEKEAAARHFAAQKSEQAKYAEADMMGRIMAHAFVQERENIEAEKTATTMPTSLARVAKRALKGGETGSHSRKLLADVVKKRGTEAAKKHGKGLAAGAAAGGAAGYMAGKSKESAAQAFEKMAAMHAIKIAEAAEFDTDEAAERVGAVYTLGLGESEKIAHVQEVDDAIHVRGLEYLEQAGYPVNWEEVFPAE